MARIIEWRWVDIFHLYSVDANLVPLSHFSHDKPHNVPETVSTPSYFRKVIYLHRIRYRYYLFMLFKHCYSVVLHLCAECTLLVRTDQLLPFPDLSIARNIALPHRDDLRLTNRLEGGLEAMLRLLHTHLGNNPG
jgi:hypothetical protein